MNNHAFDNLFAAPAVDGAHACESVPPFAGGRDMVEQAMALTIEFGEDAVDAATLRAAQSRARGNIISYCQWREVERLLALDSAQSGGATKH
jgi:hypothetical protein